MSVIALFATANTVLVAMIVGSRMMWGMARDSALPLALTSIHKKRGTPFISILAIMLLSLLFLGVSRIEILANVTSFAAFLTFTLVNASLILSRYKNPKKKRTFLVPLNIGKFPMLAFLGLVTAIFMLFQFEKEIAFVVGTILFVGIAFFYLSTKRLRLHN